MSDDRYYTTGYWADIKYPHRMGKVHIKSYYSDRPVCQKKIGKNSQFLEVAKGVYLNYVTCIACRNRIIKEKK